MSLRFEGGLPILFFFGLTKGGHTKWDRTDVISPMHGLKAHLTLTFISGSMVFLFLPPFFVLILVADKIDTTYVKQVLHVYDI